MKQLSLFVVALALLTAKVSSLSVHDIQHPPNHLVIVDNGAASTQDGVVTKATPILF